MANTALLADAPERLTETQLAEYARPLKHDYVSCLSGLYWQQRFLAGPFASGFNSACAALQDRRAGSLLCVISPAELQRHGLPVDSLHTKEQASLSNLAIIRCLIFQ